MWLRDTVPGFVSDISDGRITVSGAWSAAPLCTCRETSHCPDPVGRLPRCATDGELVDTLNCLAQRGFMLMDWNHSWHPAAVAEDLRDRGFAVGAFRTVTFDGTWFREAEPSLPSRLGE
jgi:hypothetical protein